LGHERAIVSHLPGTTRDTIEETANVRGIPVVFIDTAGLREAQDVIEAEGVRRSHESLARAELVLHVLDRSEEWSVLDESFLRDGADRPRILVLNKCDLPARLVLREPGDVPVIPVSCRTGEGVEALKDAIRDRVWGGRVGGEMLEVMINSRHQEALNRAREAAARSLEALRAGETLDLVAVELHLAVNAVGEVVGKTTTEDLLDLIFSQFCIGK
jgi:tRNA modification GTPase